MTKPQTMAELLSSLEGRKLSWTRGEEVTGVVIEVTEDHVNVDLGTKTEGLLSRKDLPKEVEFRVGDKIKAFVVVPEDPSGITVLSLQKAVPVNTKSHRKGIDPRKWQRLIQSLKSGSELSGEVLEANKGGFVVEVEGIRGFLPSSQLNLETVGLGDSLVGREISVRVIEADQAEFRLIFTVRKSPNQEVLDRISSFQDGQLVRGRVAGIVPFGLYLDLDGVEGFVRTADLAWERVEDPSQLYRAGSEVEGKVIGKDLTLGRILLSLKVLTEDPFALLSKKYQVDDMVSGVVTEVAEAGIRVSLKQEEGSALRSVDGFVPLSSIPAGTDYQLGQSANFLVASIDQTRRRLELAPLLTSTTGLLYR